jgi:hypothetical protein
MTVRELTDTQAESLVGKQWGAQGQFFNVQIDADNKKFISNEEVNGCTLQQAIEIGCDSWLLTLPEIDYNPIIIEI